MSNIFTLASYEEEADKKYGSFTIDLGNKVTCNLRNPLRLPDEKQERVFELIDELTSFEKNKAAEEAADGKWTEVGGDDEHSLDDLKRMKPIFIEFLTLVGDKNVDKLIARVKDDFAILSSLFQDYFKEVGLGEASSSEDS